MASPELLDQAADKLLQATGLRCSVEKAEETCLDSWHRGIPHIPPVGGGGDAQHPRILEMPQDPLVAVRQAVVRLVDYDGAEGRR